MAEAEDAPAANPDAQTTVNDFLDYTEFFPSDLVRSLTLIGDLDATYSDAVQQVHELTSTYGRLPDLPEPERADPVLLRKQISQYLQKAINQREYAYTEASRLYEVTVRHCQRSSIIKRKLQAQPQPPSRDPTPPPVSPHAQRPLHRTYERTPHLRLTFDGGRHGGGGARPRDRHRKPGQLPSRRSRAHSTSSDESDASNIDLLVSPKKIKQRRDRHGPPARARAPGVLGTNVHSSIAGISTSNALAQLAPPPPDAVPGSKWAPWMKLTEYEMAVLRKQMKKNAVWTPSLTMVNRELERKHRTQADYEREKARCEVAGEEMLDEEPESLQQLMTNSGLGQLAQVGPIAVTEPAEPVREGPRDDGGTISIRLKPPEALEGKRMDRLSQRQQAMRDAQELENVSTKLQEAAENMKDAMTAPMGTPLSQKKKSASRPTNKRKRDSTPLHAYDDTIDTPREASVATQDSGPRQPVPKRPRLQLQLKPSPRPDTASPAPTAASALSTPKETPNSIEPSPAAQTPVPIPEPKKAISDGITVQVPLAPAGPSTPKAKKATPAERSRQPTPEVSSPLESSASPEVEELEEAEEDAEELDEPEESGELDELEELEAVEEDGEPEEDEEPEQPEEIVTPPSPAPPPPAATITAASSRPRRESVAPKTASPSEAPLPPLKSSKASTPIPESIPDAPVHVMRPRSARGHVPTPKAQSEEPKPNDITRLTRETRRHSIFSQSALTAPVATRMSTRKKPPPKGEVTAAEDGQKTVTNVKRAQGSKNKKKKKPEEEPESVDDIDPDEPRYCVCDDVSYGPMISCDNNCDKEWFHMPCMNMTEADIPSRRAKWYCPDCRVALGTDAYGNPLVPPPLPGRRGNR